MPLRFEAAGSRSFVTRGSHGCFRFDSGGVALWLPSTAQPVRMSFRGANPNVKGLASDPVSGSSNYLRGSDPSQWRTGVTAFSRVSYREIYPGIEVVYLRVPSSSALGSLGFRSLHGQP